MFGSIAMTWTVDPLLQEYVNEKLFESIVKTKIATDRVVPETAEHLQRMSSMLFVMLQEPFHLSFNKN